MSSAALTLVRLARRLSELRTDGGRPPLTGADLDLLAGVQRKLAVVVRELTAAEATLAESRGLELEDTRALLAQARTTERAASMQYVLEARRVGRVRTAAQTYWKLVRGWPRDAAWAGHLAGFGHLLEEFGVGGAGATRALAGSLAPDWWRDPEQRSMTESLLAEIRIDWARLPERTS